MATSTVGSPDTFAGLTAKRKTLSDRRSVLDTKLASAREKAGAAQRALAEGQGQIDAAAEAQARSVALAGALATLDRSIGEIEVALAPFEAERTQRHREKELSEAAAAAAKAYEQMLAAREALSNQLREANTSALAAYHARLQALTAAHVSLLESLKLARGESHYTQIPQQLQDFPGAGDSLFGLNNRLPRANVLPHFAGTVDLPKVTGWEVMADNMASMTTIGTAE